MHPMTPNDMPRGLVLFPPGTSAAFRRRRIVFAAVYAVVAACLVWPVYPLAASAFPLILGLPLSFAWMVGALVAGFLTLLALYLGDARDEARRR
jgi:hypothetical protein